MKTLFIVLLVVHGLIHLLLHQPSGRLGGAVWLVASIAFLASALLLGLAPSQWWIAAVPAVTVRG